MRGLMTLSPDAPIAGLLAPLFALRRTGDLGIGDTAALREFVDWAAENGFALVQLLPINETGADNSPYNAVSSAAIEPGTLTISPETIPELSAEFFTKTLAEAGVEKLRVGPVAYAQVKALKRTLLAEAFEVFAGRELRRNTRRAREFRAWVEGEKAWLEGYSVFRVLMERHGTECWDRWPAEHASLGVARLWLENQSARKRREFERAQRFYQYVQWIAFAQWRKLRAHCDARGVALMGDVPFGVSYYSSDVFSRPVLFDLKWSGGAPPEQYFKDDEFTQKWGQNWGVPLYDWEAMRAEDYAWWRQRVRMVREIFHLFRIDHVLGFYRIYGFPWRPERNAEFLPLTEDEARARTGGALPHFVPRDDETEENGEANRREGEERLRVLLAEVGEHRLIGEDLGVVPPYVRPNLTAHGIAGFKIPIWEREGNGLADGREYQRLSVAAYATHDHEPLRALWERWLAAANDGDDEALAEMRGLAAFAGMGLDLPLAWSDFVHETLLRALFASNSWLAICMITDLFGTAERFNVPGATADSNWSARLPRTIAEWREDDGLVEKMERVERMLAETGRS